MGETKGTDYSRRSFMKSASVAAAASTGLGYFAMAGEGRATKGFKIALIGCGGRGSGAIKQSMVAGKTMGLNMKAVAVADFMKDRAENIGNRHGVPKERCFVGPTAYKRVMASDADIVLIATSPNFRPVHVEAAIKAGKHVFMEKPVAVDPVGARRIMAAGELAKEKKLLICAGTQRRHQKNYRDTYQAVGVEGKLGRIYGGRVSWCGGRLWFKTRDPGESDASYLVRNWVSFTEMSGDHVVEQHVHNLDVANWFIGRHPVSAMTIGMRARRRTGTQYDMFSADLDYGQGLNIHSMCRQISGCSNWVGESLVYEKGVTNGASGPAPDKKDNMPKGVHLHKGGNSGHQQEHFNLLNELVSGRIFNEAQNVAEATMTAIMIRMSAYTGKKIKWSDMMKSDFQLSPSPEDFEKGLVKAPKDDVIALPGK